MLHDIIGWLANLFFVFGTILIAHKKITGFYMNTIANSAYIIVGYLTHTYSLITISIFLVFINFYGIYQWRTK